MPTGENWELRIPFDTTLTLSVVAGGLALSDSNNLPLPATGLSLTIQHVTGQPDPPPIKFTIAGTGH
ncbi:hypothetical protein SBA4_5450006 [Candidatus Sulfopaludibacter sp. SbA4]|nr:hypothetical protein SBA4_5450006 [Candidatus Sulfopaludibacter sp. SbA4]